MGLNLKIVSILLLIVGVSLTGTLMFLKGFLLSRTVIEGVSVCRPSFVYRPDYHHDGGVDGCWMHGRFKRAIVIVIDALRYDFLIHNSSSSSSVGESNYLNKLSNVANLHRNKPKNSRLYKFIADPPTTTMQRLKGLTTGSLPTFVDAGSNFQSSKITEDNWIDQIISAEKKIKFFGDDTWLSLYPGKFYKSFGFPSFDVKDLHTVDNGILENLYPELRRYDWDVAIAHFLGVDHCGHRYGPNHPAMAEKLMQMNEVIGNVTKLMKEDTVLFVMGDHGMTRTGDHGGDSDAELTAGLWVYSPAQLSSYRQEKIEEEVAQTDFVPTLSLLLGLPIPFSNLGKIIPELFSHCPWWGTDTNELKRRYHSIEALRVNANQVQEYLQAYQAVSSDLPRRVLHDLTERLTLIESLLSAFVTKTFVENPSGNAVDDMKKIEKVYISYLDDARDLCRSVWAKFDMQLIALGLVTMLVGFFLILYLFFLSKEEIVEFPKSVGFIVGGAILHLVVLAIHLAVFPRTVPPIMCFVIAVVLMFTIFVMIKDAVKEYVMKSFTIDNIVALVLIVMSCAVYFSNSFVVHEDVISVFFLQTLLVSMWFSINYEQSKSRVKLLQEKPENVSTRIGKKSKPQSHWDTISQFVSSQCFITFIMVLSCMALVQISSNFKACREEQHDCTDSVFLSPLATLERTTRNQRYFFSLACLAVVVYAMRYWLKFYGNLNGTRFSIFIVSYLPWCGVVFTCLHWAMQSLPSNLVDRIPQWQQVLMAQIVYTVIIIGLLALLVSPLLVYVQTRQASPTMSLASRLGDNKSQAIPTIYNQLRIQMASSSLLSSSSDENKPPPMVYGLGSVYCASVISFVGFVFLYLCLLVNDGVSPSLSLALTAFYLALELYATLSNSIAGDVRHPSLSGMVLLSLFTTVYFYMTGHQATIPNIRMEAAYTGFYGNFNTLILPGFLIWSNTFASHILFGLASPLLVFWPYLSSALLAKVKGQKQEQSSASWQGDFELFDDGVRLRKRFLHLFCGILMVSSLKVLSAACAATLHRRHLMVWKIFAPRLIYEAAMFVTMCVVSLVSYLFVIRVDSTLSKFVKALPSASHKED